MLHNEGAGDLLFRLMGVHSGRAFIINVQLSAEDALTGSGLKPPEYGYAVSRLLQLLTVQVAATGKLALRNTSPKPN